MDHSLEILDRREPVDFKAPNVSQSEDELPTRYSRKIMPGETANLYSFLVSPGGIDIGLDSFCVGLLDLGRFNGFVDYAGPRGAVPEIVELLPPDSKEDEKADTGK